ncbi:MAG: cation-translocating P-type ATPase [Candidatus Kapaibacterium sp.]
MNIHAYSIEELTALLETSRHGLTHKQAQARLNREGANELQEKAVLSPVRILLAQFANFMIVVLAAAAAISFALGDATDAMVILCIVVLNAVVGFIQEYRAEQALAALKSMSAPTARVVRDGHAAEVPARELVRGDVIILESGNIVPADARLLEVFSLRVDEAALTGESQAVYKNTDSIAANFLPIGDRTNMVFKGTHVTHGNAHAMVVATGMETELGKIAAMLQDEDSLQTPLQRRLERFGRKLAYMVLGICAFVAALGLLRGEDPLTMALTAISLAVAAIPEALPAVVTVALALSAKRMTKHHALIRRLPAVETLGSVTYICTDKTGTLTQQKMSVREIVCGAGDVYGADHLAECSSHANAPQLLRMMAISNDVEHTHSGAMLGEATELAFVHFAEWAGVERSATLGTHVRLKSLPFDSSRKCMSTIHQDADKGETQTVMYTKGAADELLPRCSKVMDRGTVRNFTAADAEALREHTLRMAAQGLRVLAFAQSYPVNKSVERMSIEDERNLVMVGVVGLIDPPRPEAKAAVAECHRASIVPVMITGDHPATARAIATELGILQSDRDELVSARELDELSDEDFASRVEHIRVYARVAPEQKLRIVKALQERGHYVAMTGDGVNDAPALKRSDIGIAMGINGTDVSKEASSMVLLDDNFSTIVHAIAEGRRVYDNIRKFIRYIMTSNSGEIWCILLAPLAGLPIPLLPVHILWINLVTDGLPALALATEPADARIMSRPPRPPAESLFAGGLGRHIILVGFIMGLVPVIVQAAALHTGDGHWQTMVFSVLCLSQIGHALSVRSERESLATQGFFSNRALAATVLAAIALQACTIYVPELQTVFKTQALTMQELFVVLVASCVVFVAVEFEKMLLRRRIQSGSSAIGST